MAKYRIFTVGLALPGDEFESVDFNSDATLLDADIILFEPTLGGASGIESYGGKNLLSEHSSFSVKQRLDHWRSEIASAVRAGKLVIIYLAKPNECYRYTGEKQYSGTGRSRVTTNMVAEVSSYEAVPNLTRVRSKSGTEIRLDKEANYLASYWSAFSSYSPYEVEVEGKFTRVLLRSRTGERVVGGAVHSDTGALLFLPPLRYDEREFVRHDRESRKSHWTQKALQFGKRLAVEIVALASGLKHRGDATPPPSWASDSRFRLASESQLEGDISKCSAEIAALQERKLSLEKNLLQAGSLRHLLYEQGKPLESAVLEALRHFKFDAKQFEDGELGLPRFGGRW